MKLSKNEFKKYIKRLPEDDQLKLIDKMAEFALVESGKYAGSKYVSDNIELLGGVRKAIKEVMGSKIFKVSVVIVLAMFVYTYLKNLAKPEG